MTSRVPPGRCRWASRGPMLAALAIAGVALGSIAWSHVGAPDQVPAVPVSADPAPEVPGPARLGLLLGGDLLLDLEPGRILSAEGVEALMPGWLALRRMPGVDLGVANLECPVSDRGAPWEGKQFTFRADPDTAVPCLASAGFDLLGLANNHALDYGREAFLDTLAALDGCGIALAGAGIDAGRAYSPAYLECDGFRLAFLAFCDPYQVPAYSWLATGSSPGIASLYPLDRAVSAVARARGQADIVVVSCHWGLEYFSVTPQQQQAARALIDAGADLIVGHHPHIPQPVEVYRGRPIIYSLGNLVFHPFQPKAREMCAAAVRWARDPDGAAVMLSLELFPLYNEGGHTVGMSAEMAGPFLTGLARSSAEYGTDFRQPDGRLVLGLGGRGRW